MPDRKGIILPTTRESKRYLTLGEKFSPISKRAFFFKRLEGKSMATGSDLPPNRLWFNQIWGV
jgi:hypothetical protein